MNRGTGFITLTLAGQLSRQGEHSPPAPRGVLRPFPGFPVPLPHVRPLAGATT